MHICSNVALVGEKRRPRVQPDAHRDWACSEALGESGGGGERSWRGREGDEERVSLRVHLCPALNDACLADHTSMLG